MAYYSSTESPFALKVLHGKWVPLEKNGGTLRVEGCTRGTKISELRERIIEENARTLYAELLGDVQWFHPKSTLMYAGKLLDDDRATLGHYGITGPGHAVVFAHWYTLNVPLSKYKLELFKKTFDKFDADGSGEIDAGELFDLMEEIGLHRTRRQIHQMVLLVDEDDSGEVSFEEFCMMMVHVMQEDGEAMLEALDGATSMMLKDTDAQRTRDSGAYIMWRPP